MKLNLIPTYQLGEALKSNHFATYSPKNGQLRLSADYVRDKNLANKFLKTFVDHENQVIAWLPAENGDISKLKGLHQVKSYNEGKTWLIALTKAEINKALKIDPNSDKEYKRLEIQTQKRAIVGIDADYVVVKPNVK